MSITRQNLSVIIVSYKSDHVIENCINSIESEIEIVVVDNSNNNKFKDRIETKYKNVKCILSKENLGMGGGNNLGIKNVKKDFALILNPDVILKKNHDFDPDKPFKVKSVDGYAMLLNLKKLKKIDNFNFFDENFFLYLENEDLCKRLLEKNENIYIVPKSKIHHLGGKAVDPKYKNEIEYLRNWHWMWSKFYFNKKHYGFFIAFLKVSKNLISAKLRFLYYMMTLNRFKRKIYQMRLLGLISSMRGKNSYYRIKI